MTTNPKICSFPSFPCVLSFFYILSGALFLAFTSAYGQGSSPSAYDELVKSAARALNDGDLSEAMKTARQASAAHPERYEAYAVAGKIASKQGKANEAKDLIAKALALAPEAKKETVRQLAEVLGASAGGGSDANLSDDDLFKLEVLTALMDKARNAAPDQRGQLFRDFLDRSADFVKAHPRQTNVWAFRALACLELNRAHDGWDAGRHLKELGAMHSDREDLRKVMVELELRRWLAQAPRDGAVLASAAQKGLQEGALPAGGDERQRSQVQAGFERLLAKAVDDAVGQWELVPEKRESSKGRLVIAEGVSAGSLSCFGELGVKAGRERYTCKVKGASPPRVWAGAEEVTAASLLGDVMRANALLDNNQFLMNAELEGEFYYEEGGSRIVLNAELFLAGYPANANQNLVLHLKIPPDSVDKRLPHLLLLRRTSGPRPRANEPNASANSYDRDRTREYLRMISP